MKGIENIIKEKLHGHKMPAPEGMFDKIQTQMGNTASTGMSIAAKAAIISGVVISGAIGSLFLFNNTNNQISEVDPIEINSNKEVLLTETTPLKEDGASKMNNEKIIKNNSIIEETLNSKEVDPRDANTISEKYTAIEESPNKDPESIKTLTIDNNINKPETSENKDYNKAEDSNTDITKEVNVTENNTVVSSKTVINKEDKHLDNNSETNPETVEETTETVELKSEIVKIPNVFTPNGDGINDTYSIEFENMESVKLMIYNEKYNVVYSSSDIDFEWDGLVNGETTAGNYTIAIQAIGKDGKVHSKVERITLR
jgi:gliding motility-associated-like protein